MKMIENEREFGFRRGMLPIEGNPPIIMEGFSFLIFFLIPIFHFFFA